MLEKDKSKFTPGSEVSLESGCKCPALDNEHGRGYMGNPGMFVLSSQCPIHWAIGSIPTGDLPVEDSKPLTMWRKFRKKPVVIEAAQWNGFEKGPHDLGIEPLNPWKGITMGKISTLEGSHEVTPGDWIIIGIKGERYPCKPDIFEATYESVEESNA